MAAERREGEGKKGTSKIKGGGAEGKKEELEKEIEKGTI